MICRSLLSLFLSRFGFLSYFLVLFFGGLLLTFLFTPNTYATQVDCGNIVENQSLNNSNAFTFTCDTSSLDISVPWFYYTDYSYNFTNSGGSFPLILYYTNYTTPITTALALGPTFSNPRSFTNVSSDVLFPFYDNVSHLSVNQIRSIFPNSAYLNFHLNYVHLVISDQYLDCDCPESPSGSINITENGTYDVTNYSEAIVDIPPIYGDYHNDLISINNSILICGAILLVLYFFYCIYRMIIKPLRS